MQSPDVRGDGTLQARYGPKPDRALQSSSAVEFRCRVPLSSFAVEFRYSGLLGALADISVEMRPAGVYVFAVIFLNVAEGGVAELDDRLIAFLAEAVLHVVEMTG